MSGDVPSAAHAVRHDLLDDIEIDDSVADSELTYGCFSCMRCEDVP